MNVAVYARVSTTKEEQNPETQLIPLRDYCKSKHYDIIEEYVDRKTASKKQSRPAYNKLLKDALYRRFDIIVVWKMDRFSRGTIKEVFDVLDKLKGYGVQVESLTEPFLNTNTPTADITLAIVAWAANMESKRIGERVTAGIQRWIKEHEGERWHSKDWNIEKAMELRNSGMGWRSIEKVMREDGYDITYAAIRKELLKRGFEKGVNLPSKNS